MIWLLKKIDLAVGWTIWIIILLILAIGAYAIGFGNWLIYKIKRRHSGEDQNQTPSDSEQVGMTGIMK